MRVLAVTLSLLALMVVHPSSAAAQTELGASVVGSGGGESGDASHTIRGTLGQTAIGLITGSSNMHGIGFWYQGVLLTVAVHEPDGTRPIRYWLSPNYPNPFNPVTTLEFSLPERGHVALKLYDAGGRLMHTMVDAEMEAGYHRVDLKAANLASGVYYCQMLSGSYVMTRRLVLLK